MATANDIQQIVNMFLAAFPNFKPTDLTPEIYFQTLQDIPSDELKAAVLHCITQAGRAFAPSIGEIRGAVSDLRRAATNVPSAYDAWQEVGSQIVSVGSYGAPAFSSPLIERTVRNLGWRNLCMSENQIADRARFVQAYEQILERATKEDIMLPSVKGYIEERGAQLLNAPADQVKQLTARLSK
jgi:hypothetical protein